MLTRTWNRLSDHQQLDTDRAKRILDLQNQLERLDIRLISDPADTAVAEKLQQVFVNIDTAVDSVRDFLDEESSKPRAVIGGT